MTTISSGSIGNNLANSGSNALTSSGNTLIDQLLNSIGLGADPTAAAQAYLAAMQAPIGAVGSYNKTAAQTTAANPTLAYLLSNPALTQGNAEQGQQIQNTEQGLGQIANTGISPADAAQLAYTFQNLENENQNSTQQAENDANNRGQLNSLSTLLLGQAGRNAASQQANSDAVSLNQQAQARRLQAQTDLGQLASATQGQDIGVSQANANAANTFATNNQSAANTVNMNNQNQANTVGLSNTSQANTVNLANQAASEKADTQNAQDQLAQLGLIGQAYGGNNGVVKTSAAQQAANGNNSLFGGSGSGGLVGAAASGINSLFGGGSSGSSSIGSSLNPLSSDDVYNDAASNNFGIPDLSSDIPSFDIAGEGASDLGSVADDTSWLGDLFG